MSELRRLLVHHDRIKHSFERDNFLELTSKESHYLSRVIRLKGGDQFQIIDGVGHLWSCSFLKKNIVKLNTDFNSPDQISVEPHPKICLAVAVPKIGFDDVIRMSCEIGIDILQPIYSERSLIKNHSSQRLSRWDSIMNEAIEQSERLWKPEFKNITSFPNWLNSSVEKSLLTIGTTRIDDVIHLEKLLVNVAKSYDEIWVAIGPEGGWTINELSLSKTKHCRSVQFGQSILRTSTAAISACQLLCSWRRTTS